MCRGFVIIEQFSHIMFTLFGGLCFWGHGYNKITHHKIRCWDKAKNRRSRRENNTLYYTIRWPQMKWTLKSCRKILCIYIFFIHITMEMNLLVISCSKHLPHSRNFLWEQKKIRTSSILYSRQFCVVGFSTIQNSVTTKCSIKSRCTQCTGVPYCQTRNSMWSIFKFFTLF